MILFTREQRCVVVQNRLFPKQLLVKSYVCVCVCVCVHIQLVLEMCRGEHPVDMQTIQPHLDRIKAPASTANDHHVSKLADTHSCFLSAAEGYWVTAD